MFQNNQLHKMVHLLSVVLVAIILSLSVGEGDAGGGTLRFYLCKAICSKASAHLGGGGDTS